MTRKDFQLIADTIKTSTTSANLERVSIGFANALMETNPRFDRNRFLKACGLEG